MRLKSLMVSMVGMAVAGMSVFAAKELLVVEPAQASLDTRPETVSVVVAGEDIDFGETILPEKLTTIQWPADAVPEGVYTSFDNLIAVAGGDPRRAKRDMAQGELVIASKVSDWGEKVTIVQTLGPGKRAVAIQVNAATAAGGFVTPGDHVDVLLTLGSGKSLRTVTILQDLRIVGIDQEANELFEQAQIARTVTVAVTADEGQKLALAQKAGTLTLSLRSLTGDDTEPLKTVSLADLLDEPEPEPEPIPVAEPVVPKNFVKIRRGNAEIEQVEVN